MPEQAHYAIEFGKLDISQAIEIFPIQEMKKILFCAKPSQSVNH